jgi:hypothetical protein
LLVSLGFLAVGCGSSSSPVQFSPRPAALSPWPSAADYGTIRGAVLVRDDALFHEPNWRRKSFGATLALGTLTTVRIAAGPCAAFVTQLYGNLLDLKDAYQGEDWRPLVRLVRRQPTLEHSCRVPLGHIVV